MFKSLTIVSFLMLIELANPAWALETFTATCARPQRAGHITLELSHNSNPPQGEWGVCTSTTEIPAGISAEQKAALIEAQINRDCPGFNVVRRGATLTISSKEPYPNTRIRYAEDSTGEVFLMDDPCGIGIPVKYVTKASLQGSCMGGLATFGENGVSETVMTAGKTIPQIYAEWQSLFGEGTVTPDGFQLPKRQTVSRSFMFEVTDPGLTIKVTQKEIEIIPTVTQWGLIAMAGLLVTVGAIVIVRHRRRVAA